MNEVASFEELVTRLVSALNEIIGLMDQAFGCTSGEPLAPGLTSDMTGLGCALLGILRSML